MKRFDSLLKTPNKKWFKFEEPVYPSTLSARIIASLKRIYWSYKARQELPPPGSSMGE